MNNLHYLRRKGEIRLPEEISDDVKNMPPLFDKDEAPMNESVDKLSIQVALVLFTYLVAYGMMYLLGNVLIGTKSSKIGTVYGFNFLFGVLAAALVKVVINALRRARVVHREYRNTFLLNRISGLAFDLMIVSGIAAIRFDVISDYLFLILLMGAIGAVVTFWYVKFICRRVFPQYEHQQFLAFFGMLTGAASTGMILLREADVNFESPVSENLVYQNFPAIVLAIPLLFIVNFLTAKAASLSSTLWMLALIVVIFIALNLALFRKQIFGRKKAVGGGSDAQ